MVKHKKINLPNIYYNPTNPLSFSGARNILKKYPKSKKEIKDWLDSQNTYTLHKPVRRKFSRLHYTTKNVDDLWEMDLADLTSLQSYNDGNKFLLVVIDVLSKYLWVEPLINKSGNTVCQALEKIFLTSGRRPVVLQSDKGKEFLNKNVQKLLDQVKIHFRVARNPDIKAAIVERVNRTLKERIYRYFTYKKTHRYIEVLPKIVQAYNNAIHSSTKMTPAAVTIYNAQKARENIEKQYTNATKKNNKYHVGDYVRISNEKQSFSKGYAGSWSKELFIISKVYIRQSLPIYEIKDLKGEDISGYFYEQEISKVNQNINEEYFDVEKILDTRGKGQKKEYLVRWKNYSSDFDEWVPASNLKDHVQ